ncbi:hypothetical protein EVAR_24724_1 [Eumeta japonica]|uniref:Uncharacterized protein n=1 Tax=Eumeta variegata TaxID=151549 RepID=A0A4C1VCZ4_EUMVA|nr:hypothetical protein EVAR_24724_1 [Eumeta japonica]
MRVNKKVEMKTYNRIYYCGNKNKYKQVIVALWCHGCSKASTPPMFKFTVYGNCFLTVPSSTAYHGSGRTVPFAIRGRGKKCKVRHFSQLNLLVSLHLITRLDREQVEAVRSEPICPCAARALSRDVISQRGSKRPVLADTVFDKRPPPRIWREKFSHLRATRELEVIAVHRHSQYQCHRCVIGLLNRNRKVHEERVRSWSQPKGVPAGNEDSLDDRLALSISAPAPRAGYARVMSTALAPRIIPEDKDSLILL